MTPPLMKPIPMTGRILVADDDSVNRQMLDKMLRAQGHTVTLAEDGRHALEQAVANPPDTILLDVVMPGLDGYTLCRRLKGDPLTAPIPILMVTALDNRTDRIAGVSAGADDFISKPVDPEELILRIRNAVHRKHLYDELARKHAELLAMAELRASLTSLIEADTEALSAFMRRRRENGDSSRSEA